MGAIESMAQTSPRISAPKIRNKDLSIKVRKCGAACNVDLFLGVFQMTYIYILAFIVASLVAGAIYRVQRERRLRILFMTDLKRLNRAKIDAPGWEKKQWQHDRGECPAKYLEKVARIEALARGTAVEPQAKPATFEPNGLRTVGYGY